MFQKISYKNYIQNSFQKVFEMSFKCVLSEVSFSDRTSLIWCELNKKKNIIYVLFISFPSW